VKKYAERLRNAARRADMRELLETLVVLGHVEATVEEAYAA